MISRVHVSHTRVDEGAIEGVVAIHRQLRDTDFVTIEAIHLEERMTLPSTRAPG